jgi:hypothetical protein
MTRRKYSETVSPDDPAALTICCQDSSSMRKYRLGVCPVAGLPGPRGFVDVAMPPFYDHPSILSIPTFMGGQIILACV